MEENDHIIFESPEAASCTIPFKVSEQIKEACCGKRNLYCLSPPSPRINLYAIQSGQTYQLHLGDPEDKPDYPTLRMYLEECGYAPDDRDSLAKYLTDGLGRTLRTEESTQRAIDGLIRRIDKPIRQKERNWWLEYSYEDSLTKAYRYLLSLPLDDGEPAEGTSLGEIYFVEGDRPGSDLIYVEIGNLAAVLGLQYRLNVLGTGARILINRLPER